MSTDVKPFRKIADRREHTTVLAYTDLSSQPRAELASVLPLPLPFSLHIEPTNICNFGCISCPQSMSTYKEDVGYHQFMDFDLYCRIVDQIAEMGRLKALKLFGYGESLLHPRLPDMIRYAKERNVTDRIEITTNASRLTRALSEDLVKSGLDYLRVSIYGVDQPGFQKFTQRKVPIERIRSNLAEFVNIRSKFSSDSPFLYVKVMEALSAKDQEEFYNQFSNIGDELAVEVLHNMSGIDGIDKKLGVEIPVRSNKRRCPLPFYQAAIGANGDLTICCIDWSFSSKIGNLKESSFSELWGSEKFNAIRVKILRDEISAIRSCKDCTWSWASTDSLDDLDDNRRAELIKAYEQ